MATMTRRTFITRTTAGAAALGVAAGALGGGIGVATADAHSASPAHNASGEPLMVYVTDAARGEVTFLQGQREIVRREPALVARLLGYMA